jgi:hypothetical protein
MLICRLFEDVIYPKVFYTTKTIITARFVSSALSGRVRIDCVGMGL